MALAFRYDSHSEIGLVRKTNQDSGYVSPTMLAVADGMGGAAAGDLASTVAARELESTDERLAERLAEMIAGTGEPVVPDAEATVVQHAGVVDEDQPTDASADDTIVQPALTVAGETDAAADPTTMEDSVDDTPVASAVSPETAVLTLMAGALQRTNDRIAQLVEDDRSLEGMGTTVCGGVLFDDKLALMNIGDSRGYLIRDGELERITHDHSWVQTLVDEGRISEAEALEHPHRSLILRVLNGNPQHEPDFSVIPLRVGDRLMFCSDGLCGLVTDEQIAARIGHDSRMEAIDDLVDLAHDAGGHDNITIIIADIVEGEPQGKVRVIGAAEHTKIPAPSENTATLTALPAVSADSAEATELSEDERYAPADKRSTKTRFKVMLGVFLPLLVLLGAGFGWYSYTQTQYYVGVKDDHVAIYQGIPDRIFEVELSKVVETSHTRVTDLPTRYQLQVQNNIRATNLDTARSTVKELDGFAQRCVAQREARARSTTPLPGPGTTPEPGQPTPSASTASPTPTPTATPYDPTTEGC